MRWSWIGFIARGYFFSKRSGKSLSGSALSVTGLALGTATLIVVIAVMNGFQSGFISSILEIGSYHVRLEAEPGMSSQLLKETRSDPRVLSATEFNDIQVLAKSAFGEPESLNLRVMDASSFYDDKGFNQALGLAEEDQTFGLPRLDSPDALILGRELLYSLGLTTGDEIELISVRLDDEEGFSPQRYRFTVAGSFTSGYYEYDRSWAFASYDSAQELLRDDGAQSLIGIKLKKIGRDAAFCADLNAKSSPSLKQAVSWRDFNRVFFGALRIEKTIILLVICLIPLVVAVNIFHALRRSVFERHEEIGLLRALGSNPAQVQAIFVLEGALIGLLGALIGLVLGLAITYNINAVFSSVEAIINAFIIGLDSVLSPLAPRQGNFAVFSTDFFYMSEVPVKVYFTEALFAFLFACLSSIGSAYLASRAVSRFQPQEILRYE